MSETTLTPTLATKWKLEVNTSATEAPDFIPVRGRKSLKPGIADTTQDVSDADGDGWASTFTTQRAFSLDVSLLRKLTPDLKYDEGQEALRLAAEAGRLVTVRWWDANTPFGEAYEGEVNVAWSPDGGGTTDVQAVTATLSGQGAPRKIANPGAPVAPPAG